MQVAKGDSVIEVSVLDVMLSSYMLLLINVKTY